MIAHDTSCRAPETDTIFFLKQLLALHLPWRGWMDEGKACGDTAGAADTAVSTSPSGTRRLFHNDHAFHFRMKGAEIGIAARLVEGVVPGRARVERAGIESTVALGRDGVRRQVIVLPFDRLARFDFDCLGSVFQQSDA